MRDALLDIFHVMYKIYLNNNYILLLTRADEIPEEVIPMEFDITKVLQKVENNNNVAIFCDDCDKFFKEFSLLFECRTACGGVVTSENFKVLMIKRLGVWDLPKGHLEKGETLEQCALREVQEECGIKDLSLGAKIKTTYHIYYIKTKLVLKTTLWYRMCASESQQLVPQTQEGISKVKWNKIAKLYKLRKKTYSNINDVLKKMFF